MAMRFEAIGGSSKPRVSADLIVDNSITTTTIYYLNTTPEFLQPQIRPLSAFKGFRGSCLPPCPRNRLTEAPRGSEKHMEAVSRVRSTAVGGLPFTRLEWA